MGMIAAKEVLDQYKAFCIGVTCVVLSACVPPDYVPIDEQIAKNTACIYALTETIKNIRQIESDLAVVRELEQRLVTSKASDSELERTRSRRIELEIKLKREMDRGDALKEECG